MYKIKEQICGWNGRKQYILVRVEEDGTEVNDHTFRSAEEASLALKELNSVADLTDDDWLWYNDFHMEDIKESLETQDSPKTPRFLVNVVFERPTASPSGEAVVEVANTTIGFDKKKDALKLFDEVYRFGSIKLNTPVGFIAFKLISVELMDDLKYKEFLEQKNDNQSEHEVIPQQLPESQ